MSKFIFPEILNDDETVNEVIEEKNVETIQKEKELEKIEDQITDFFAAYLGVLTKGEENETK
ncbi:hypothetical protein [uncultured Dubosiella sp.]|uniref:hypothetical protein n=1 Tax=uncultured Dubosiella sp. TaxID=1937011 RepID=UPI0022BA8EF9|nr:hypothetical protein [uncultured Dubosiella sp.]MCZ2855909.1 hypothetical protein [Candidatus Bathyarchaeota archaeon]